MTNKDQSRWISFHLQPNQATAEMMMAPPVMEDEEEVTDSQQLLLHISLDVATAALWTGIEEEEESWKHVAARWIVRCGGQQTAVIGQLNTTAE